MGREKDRLTADRRSRPKRNAAAIATAVVCTCTCQARIQLVGVSLPHSQWQAPHHGAWLVSKVSPRSPHQARRRAQTPRQQHRPDHRARLDAPDRGCIVDGDGSRRGLLAVKEKNWKPNGTGRNPQAAEALCSANHRPPADRRHRACRNQAGAVADLDHIRPTANRIRKHLEGAINWAIAEGKRKDECNPAEVKRLEFSLSFDNQRSNTTPHCRTSKAPSFLTLTARRAGKRQGEGARVRNADGRAHRRHLRRRQGSLRADAVVAR